MTEFCKYWITSTCAPESIVIVKQSAIGALLGIRDEFFTMTGMLIEHFATKKIVGMGYTYEGCCIPVSYTFSEASDLIVEKMGLLRIQV